MSGTHNIVAEQGSTYKLIFSISIDGSPWNLSDYTARMQVRADYNTSTKYLNLSTDTGEITINSSGEFVATVDAVTMSKVPAGRWVYDVEFESTGGEVTRVLEGKFLVTPEVTQ